LLLAGWGHGERIEVDTQGDPQARLEVRNHESPGGELQRFYVVRAEEVVIRATDLTIRASHVQFNPETGEVRIIGRGRVEREGETLVGQDLTVDLPSGRLDGNDVIAFTDRIDVRGVSARRVAGRIQLDDGAFSPCSRCGQSTEDYGFQAARIELLPGDRLIAYDAIVLIRDRPFVPLPVLVLPLADPDRIPSLRYQRGAPSNTTPADLAVAWPYVAGANAYGTVTARTVIDVDEGGSRAANVLLGGQPTCIQWLGSVDHLFLTPRGLGTLVAEALPLTRPCVAEVENPESLRAQYRFKLEFATDEVLAAPITVLRVELDDENRPGLLEVEASRREERGPLGFEVQTQFPVELTRDVSDAPSWNGSRNPRATPLLTSVELLDGSTVETGLVDLRDARVDIGVFGDESTPESCSAAGRELAATGQVRLRHDLNVRRVRFGAFSLTADNRFDGRYYGTRERLVEWDTSLQGNVGFLGSGELDVTLRRDLTEGETPFAFERTTSERRTRLDADASWPFAAELRLSGEAGFVFESLRNPNLEGYAPTRLTLEAFTGTPWAEFRVEHRAEPRVEDWGTLEVRARAGSLGDWRVGLEVGQLTDLDAGLPDEPDGDRVRDEGRVDAAAELGRVDWLLATAEGAYVREPPLGEGPWEPLEMDAEVGTVARGDLRPGVTLRATRDVNEGETTDAGYLAALDAGPLRFEAEQDYNREGEAPGLRQLRVRLVDAVRLTVDGIALVPGSTLGLAPDPLAVLGEAVTLTDEPGFEALDFEVRARRERQPQENAPALFRDTQVFTSLRVAPAALRGRWFAADLTGTVDVRLADDRLPASYLRLATVEAYVDVADRFGVQGAVGYTASLGDDLQVAQAALSLDEVAVTARMTRGLYVGAVWNDVWDVVAVEGDGRPVDLRPEAFVTWDRCCWATYGRWDTRSGEIEITVGGPNMAIGPQWSWSQGPSLPAPEGSVTP
jgi:hypothetical protein